MTDNFYREFEDKHRGSRELIKSRLEVYLPFVKLLLHKSSAKPNRALDLGCGRGEWLELLKEQGFNAQGVDLDEGMLEACELQGFSVEKEDAISYLHGQKDNSFAVISGFHIAEHLPFDKLRTLIDESFRVLTPGGLLVLETPNPENIVVGTTNFYLDPTHEQPLPTNLLSFVAEFSGFVRVKVLGLQAANSIKELEESSQSLSLMDVLGGVSPDYSIVAQKQGPKKLISRFDALFSKEYGVTLHEITSLYEKQQNERATVLNQQARELANSVVHLEGQLEVKDDELSTHQAANLSLQEEMNATKPRIEQFIESLAIATNTVTQLEGQLGVKDDELSTHQAANLSLQEQLNNITQKSNEQSNELDEVNFKIDELNQSSHHWWTIADQQGNELDEARAKIDELHQSNHRWWLEVGRLKKELQTVYKSKSWRITWPLRAIVLVLRWLIMLPFHVLKWLLRPLVVITLRQILCRPVWLMRLKGTKNWFPKLYEKARRIALAHGLVGMPNISNSESQKGSLHMSSIAEDNDSNSNMKGAPESLSSSAKVIYLDLLSLQLSTKNGELK
ncbi:MAG: methyltransferase domain-containing protein [Cycloclasticus sp.]